MGNPYVPLLFFLAIGGGFAIFSVAIAPLTGPRRYNRAKVEAYECGIQPSPQAEGGGRVAAYEVLMANEAVKNLLREGKTRQLRNAMISAQQDGMQTLEMDLARLVASGMVSIDTATEVSQFPKEVLAQAATMRAQLQAQATVDAGQYATTGAGTVAGQLVT